MLPAMMHNAYADGEGPIWKLAQLGSGLGMLAGRCMETLIVGGCDRLSLDPPMSPWRVASA